MLSSSVWRGGSHWWFSTGLVLGGLPTGLLTITLSSLLIRPFLPRTAVLGLLGALAVIVVAHEWGVLSLPLPQNARQVPELIAEQGPRSGALQFGFEMGTGLRTFMTSALPHLLLATVALLATLPEALLAGAGFGAGRAAMILIRRSHRDDSTWDEALDRQQSFVRVILGLAFLALLITLSLRQ